MDDWMKDAAALMGGMWRLFKERYTDGPQGEEWWRETLDEFSGIAAKAADGRCRGLLKQVASAYLVTLQNAQLGNPDCGVSEVHIEWDRDAGEIARMVRPGTYVTIRDGDMETIVKVRGEG